MTVLKGYVKTFKIAGVVLFGVLALGLIIKNGHFINTSVLGNVRPLTEHEVTLLRVEKGVLAYMEKYGRSGLTDTNNLDKDSPIVKQVLLAPPTNPWLKLNKYWSDYTYKVYILDIESVTHGIKVTKPKVIVVLSDNLLNSGVSSYVQISKGNAIVLKIPENKKDIVNTN